MKTNLFSTSVVACSILGLGFLASPASGAVFIQTGNGSIFTNSTDGSNPFTPASGNTLNIGSTLDVTGPYAATATALVGTGGTPYPIINVFGTSSLQFLGTDNTARTQQVTVNFNDASQFLIDPASHTFRTAVTIGYSSSANSVSSGNLVFQTGGDPSIININSGSVTIGNLSPSDKQGRLNLNGGNFNVSGVNYTTGFNVFNINFTSLSSGFTLVGAANIDALNTQIADGLFQINGVDQTSLVSYNRNFSGGNLTISAVPEPATMALLAASLTGIVIFRRRRA